jgi:Ser/Thr protein kinase RdoA (MazF antagonist)
MPQASLIGHNDIAPYNVCFDGDEVAGVFDWDPHRR